MMSYPKLASIKSNPASKSDPEFMELTSDQLEGFLSVDHLAGEEADILNALVSWVSHNPDFRVPLTVIPVAGSTDSLNIIGNDCLGNSGTAGGERGVCRLLKYIRYGLISEVHLKTLVLKDEVEKLSQLMHRKGPKNTSILLPVNPGSEALQQSTPSDEEFTKTSHEETSINPGQDESDGYDALSVGASLDPSYCKEAGNRSIDVDQIRLQHSQNDRWLVRFLSRALTYHMLPIQEKCRHSSRISLPRLCREVSKSSLYYNS
ncbi:unnamed protein product [Protopolystoma xenopodis]|uniref:BACK domain-containing protein n=1 Tax=Protopolystoma xenopodis TaxID=117903 RepID=A0A448WLA8_9PLAT|nr:unnamed protein product [Protopolystoma xenopodis]